MYENFDFLPNLGLRHCELLQIELKMKCSVCSSVIAGSYFRDEWGNVSHNEHGGTMVTFCESCDRIISKNTSKAGLKINGKLLCGYCHETLVTNNEISPILRSVKLMLGLVGFRHLPEKVEIEIKSQKTMNEISSDFSNNVRGLAQTTTYIDHNGKRFSHKIFLLNTLTKLQFEGVLAHELIHIWLNQNEIVLEEQECEGLCNLGAYLIYINDHTAYGKLLLKKLNYNPDIIYGDGYRKMKDNLDSASWRKLLDTVKLNRVYK